MIAPPHTQQGERHDHVEPRAHEDNPCVHGLLKMQAEAFGISQKVLKKLLKND